MTEIFGTLGPACRETDILRRMLEEGMTGIRLNMSHTSLRESAEYLDHFRQAQELSGIRADLMIDLQGPELRIREQKEKMVLREGETVHLVNPDFDHGRKKEGADTGNGNICVEDPVFHAIRPGDKILLDDGLIELGIPENGFRMEGLIAAQIVRGGTLFGRKSIKIVGRSVKMPVLTSQDMENISCASEYGVTALMQPFVTDGEELRGIRALLKEKELDHIRLFAKIENREGVHALESILPWADVIVIARGDLGNDMPLWELPAVQKQIAEICREYGKDFLVVTQMLTSMMTNPVPTRAEVSDIFNAVADGASAVMATNETAAGNHPVEVIRYLRKTCEAAEKYGRFS